MKGGYVERFHGHDTLSGLYLPLYFISSQSISSLAGVNELETMMELRYK